MVESALVMETIGAPVHCTTLDTTVKQILSLQLHYSELLDVSSCSGRDSIVCKGRRLSVICKSMKARGQALPEKCDELNYIQ